MKAILLPTVAAAMILAGPSHADQPKYLGAAIQANSMFEYNANGQYTGALINGATLGGPQHGCLDPSGEILYVPQASGGPSVRCYDVRTGALLCQITHPAFVGLTSVTFSPDGLLVISDFYGSQVYNWDLDTNTLIGAAIDGGHMVNPHEVLFRDGRMYVSDWAAGAIVQFEVDGTFTRILNNGPQLVGPLGMVFTEDGASLLVVNNFPANVSRFRLSDGAFTGNVVPVGSGLLWPEGIDIGHDGSLVIASPGNATIRRYDRTTGTLLSTFQTGLAGSVDVIYVPPHCPADSTNDGIVGVNDLLETLATWGACLNCATDVDYDGNVGISDFLAVLAAWGSCDN